MRGAGNIPMSTCSIPFYGETDGTKHLKGIVTADISLDSLTELISSVKILKTGYAALLSHNGMMLAHPLKDTVMNETFFSIAEARHDLSLRELGKKMVRGKSGFLLYTSLVGVRNWMYYAPIRATGWTLAVVFPEAELLENVTQLSVTIFVVDFDQLDYISSAGLRVLLATAKRLKVKGGQIRFANVKGAFVNICSYAYPEGSGEVELACGADGDAFVLEIADRGSPFDALSLPEPDSTPDIMDREIGGLGVHFIRKLSDSVSYRREDGQNILRMVFNRREGGASGKEV